MKRIASGLGLATTAVLLTATAAQAHHLNVAVNGDTTPGTVSYTAASTSAGINFDTDFGVPMTCSGSTAAGDIARGAGVPGNMASLTSSTWTGCVAPTLFNTEFEVTQVGTWQVNTTDHPDVSGVAPGSITNVSAQVRSVDSNGTETHDCDFNVTGSVTGSFDSSSAQQLTVDGSAYTLDIEVLPDSGGVNDGCFGEVTDADSAKFTGTYDVAATGGDVTFQ